LAANVLSKLPIAKRFLIYFCSLNPLLLVAYFPSLSGEKSVVKLVKDFSKTLLSEVDSVNSLFNGELVGILLPVAWDWFFYD
jgi:hypothetical protein